MRRNIGKRVKFVYHHQAGLIIHYETFVLCILLCFLCTQFLASGHPPDTEHHTVLPSQVISSTDGFTWTQYAGTPPLFQVGLGCTRMRALHVDMCDRDRMNVLRIFCR